MRDVRMKGFAERTDIEVVEQFLAERAKPLGGEPVAIVDAIGRVLAEPVRSEVDVPSFRRSAMDGYAVRGEETFGASPYDPIVFSVLGQALPGAPFAGDMPPGTAVRVMTGAPVPDGADAVVMAEVCDEADGRVEVREAVAPRKHVGAIGEDIRSGDAVLAAGRRLRPQDAALLASIGVAEPSCVRRPRVSLLITGDELLPPGARPHGAHIVDSNSLMLTGLAERDGAQVLPHAILPDRVDTIRDALASADAEVLLVSGGSSVGQEDHAPRLVAELGELDFHGVSMRPSSPAGVGRLPGIEGGRERFVFLLPGNPVSCLCAYEFFAGPTLRALGGRSRAWPHPRIELPLARKIASAVGRTDYVRVAIEADRVVPLATSGASILSSTVRADGCVIVPRSAEGMPEGARVEVLLYDETHPGRA
ncbi:MAG: gephyrin-like molybdotransferase Glp [Myxococcota bacterium]